MMIPMNESIIPNQPALTQTMAVDVTTINTWLEFLSKQVGDFEFTFDDGTSIFGHTSFLKLPWEYFRVMCESGMNESIDKKMHVHGCKSVVFNKFLRFLYTSQLPVETDDDEELYMLAHLYLQDSLISKLECRLLKYQLDTVIDFLFRFGYKYPSLQEKCLAYIEPRFIYIRGIKLTATLDKLRTDPVFFGIVETLDSFEQHYI